MPACARHLRPCSDHGPHLAHSRRQSRAAARPADASLRVPPSFLEKLRPDDIIRLRDARKGRRTLRVTRVETQGCWAEGRRTTYFVPGLQLRAFRRASAGKRSGNNVLRTIGKATVGELPHLPQTLLLKLGDTLLLTRSPSIGRPATYRKTGKLLSPARIGVSLPQILDHAKPGDPVWFDDGKIGGVIRSVDRSEERRVGKERTPRPPP